MRSMGNKSQKIGVNKKLSIEKICHSTCKVHGRGQRSTCSLLCNSSLVCHHRNSQRSSSSCGCAPQLSTTQIFADHMKGPPLPLNQVIIAAIEQKVISNTLKHTVSTETTLLIMQLPCALSHTRDHETSYIHRCRG